MRTQNAECVRDTYEVNRLHTGQERETTVPLPRNGGTLRSAVPAAASADPTSFRTLMGRYPTGVVLVTAATEDGPVGMAVNSFTSVSLTPPLVSFCPALSSDTWSRLRPQPGFAVNILGGSHEDICRLFSRHGADRFGQHKWDTTPDGHPLLPDAVGWIDTRVEKIHPAGDHELVIARATGWSVPQNSNPLVFFGGQFHALQGDLDS